MGYHPQAVREYLLTLLNSNYEEWRADNPLVPAEEFPFSTEKMSTSGALFDINKLNDVSKDTLVHISAEDLYGFLTKWAEEFCPDACEDLADKEYLLKILDLGRSGNKPRKDFVCASQMFDFIGYFFDDYYKLEDEIPEQVSKEDAAKILDAYLATYDHSDEQPVWFDKIRTLGTELGYAAKPKDFKKNPDDYKGHVGHVSGVIRLAIVGRASSPDVWEIQQILGEERTKARIAKMRESL
jgi:glutamyl-tRNA synthetase